MANKETVFRWLDDNADQTAALLQALVRIPSINPYFDGDDRLKGEGRAQEYLKAYLEDMGFTVRLDCPDVQALAAYAGKAGYCPDHVFAGRPNLSAEWKGTGGGRSILLSGHMDVVGVGEGWTDDPFSGKIENGRVFGRGAVDMKGGITSMTMAVRAIRQAGIRLKGDVRIGTVVDEEAGGMGTLALVAQGMRADGCLLTEGTKLNLQPLCRGILWGKIIIEGQAGHIELKRGDWRAGGAVDAVDKAALLLDHLERLNRRWAAEKRHKYLPIPCQVNVAQFEAGEYPTTFANHAELTFDAQYLPAEKDENGLGGKVKREIEECIAAAAKTDPWLCANPPRVEWILDADCGETFDTEPFFRSVRGSFAALRPEMAVEGNCAHTDMGWLCNVGIPTMNFGPGDPKYAHQGDEQIEISQLVQAAKMIAAAILDWCGVDESESRG